MVDGEDWAQFTIRCPSEMRRKAELSADAVGQSLAEWIRRAIQEKLDHEVNGDPDISDEKLRETIRSVVEEMLEEKRGRK